MKGKQCLICYVKLCCLFAHLKNLDTVRVILLLADSLPSCQLIFSPVSSSQGIKMKNKIWDDYALTTVTLSAFTPSFNIQHFHVRCDKLLMEVSHRITTCGKAILGL